MVPRVLFSCNTAAAALVRVAAAAALFVHVISFDDEKSYDIDFNAIEATAVCSKYRQKAKISAAKEELPAKN